MGWQGGMVIVSSLRVGLHKVFVRKGLKQSFPTKKMGGWVEKLRGLQPQKSMRIISFLIDKEESIFDKQQSTTMVNLKSVPLKADMQIDKYGALFIPTRYK
jgi:hypothetical protein